ncbi:MAG: hypothetical protein JKY96_05620 [Phycisphaerales bacterium]|nr:hypothetical protein [Phycisphaerales bacterium]
MPRKAKPTDDRGVPCTIVKLSAKQIGMRSLSMAEMIPDKVLRKEKFATLLQEFLVIFIVILASYLFWHFFISPYTAPVLGMIFDITINTTVAIVISFVVLYFLINPLRQTKFHRIAKIYLDQARCPGCGYTLTAIAPNEDDCIVCPECNAAWNESRLGTPVDS